MLRDAPRELDDMHKKQGCVLAEQHSWGAWFSIVQARPPSLNSKDWRRRWLSRLQALGEPAEAAWLRADVSDKEYWRIGSPKADDVKVPVFSIGCLRGGGYVDSIPELCASLDRRGINNADYDRALVARLSPRVGDGLRAAGGLSATGFGLGPRALWVLEAASPSAAAAALLGVFIIISQCRRVAFGSARPHGGARQT